MSSGPEHYVWAEQLINQLDQLSPSVRHEVGAHYLAEAQVHATLALAAATLSPCYRASRTEDWSDAIKPDNPA